MSHERSIYQAVGNGRDAEGRKGSGPDRIRPGGCVCRFRGNSRNDGAGDQTSTLAFTTIGTDLTSSHRLIIGEGKSIQQMQLCRSWGEMPEQTSSPACSPLYFVAGDFCSRATYKHVRQFHCIGKTERGIQPMAGTSIQRNGGTCHMKDLLIKLSVMIETAEGRKGSGPDRVRTAGCICRFRGNSGHDQRWQADINAAFTTIGTDLTGAIA